MHAVEMSSLKGACGLLMWDGEHNESIYVRFAMGRCGNGVNCGVVE